jgi:CCR4-NOT transcription complex subunit 6
MYKFLVDALFCRDPEWIDVKLAQAKYLLSRVSQFQQLISNKYNCKPSVIIAGDFNSTPGDKVCHIYFIAFLMLTDLKNLMW